MGLDPVTRDTLSALLRQLARSNAPRLVLSLRPQDPLPDWITHIVQLESECKVADLGLRKDEHIPLAIETPGMVEACSIDYV